MVKKLKYLDLFAGAGGLSEGFVRAGFRPIAHVESDIAACYTLKTRTAYHWLNAHNQVQDYYRYLNNQMTREQLYNLIPARHLTSVINQAISEKSQLAIFASIDKLLGGKSLDLIIGGPPCQAYSLIGRSRDQNKMRGDHRNYLYVYYSRFLKRYAPKFFVFENVTGLVSAKTSSGAGYLTNMLKLFKRIGYTTEFKILTANDYGVLQNRKRIILVGRKGSLAGFYPQPDKWIPGAYVNEVLDDLPALKAGLGDPWPCRIKPYNGDYLYEAGIRDDNTPVTLHWSRPNTKQDLEIYRIAVKKWNSKKERLNYNDLPERLKSHENRASFLDRFKVVAADLPYSHTVVAHIAKDGHYYIHPDLQQNRSLTPREAARLQTFPDDYYFESISGKPGRTPAFRQIGNAVPVTLAQKLACKLLEVWD